MPNSLPFPKTDVRSAWKRDERRLDAMTKEERLASLVNAGILTPKGNFRKPYRRLARMFGTAKSAAAGQK